MVITSVMVGSDALIKRFSYSEKDASVVIELQFLVAAFLLPLFGWLIDKRGKIILVLIFGGVVNLGTHLLTLFLPDCTEDDRHCMMPMVPFMIYGLNFTIYIVAMWGSIPYMVNDKKSLGTAYGILACL